MPIDWYSFLLYFTSTIFKDHEALRAFFFSIVFHWWNKLVFSFYGYCSPYQSWMKWNCFMRMKFYLIGGKEFSFFWNRWFE
jgi:hypothetical protein